MSRKSCFQQLLSLPLCTDGEDIDLDAEIDYNTFEYADVYRGAQADGKSVARAVTRTLYVSDASAKPASDSLAYLWMHHVAVRGRDALYPGLCENTLTNVFDKQEFFELWDHRQSVPMGRYTLPTPCKLNVPFAAMDSPSRSCLRKRRRTQ
ncbi:hypothetical protein FB451DRAFT_1362391 [Mycena latifolia]|nr:hypothetical protein FB451DRAFT_1362391 [Mycena latifolia]